MASTKTLSKEERKKSKRNARKELKSLFKGLSKKAKSEFNTLKSKTGIKKFVADKKK
ncbi:MAG: hypothetical protein ACI86H_000788 [bacterium]|jgi:hypothetical protein